MTILKPQFFRGASVKPGDRIETESRKVAAVLTKLGRAREIPDVDLSEPFNLPEAEVRYVPIVIADLASKDDQVAVVPAKRAYKKRAYKRRGPAKRK